MRESRILRRERQEGRQEGRIEAQRDLVFRVLRQRFGQENVASFEGRVQTENRPEELVRWHDLAVTAKDLPAFLADVGG